VGIQSAAGARSGASPPLAVRAGSGLGARGCRTAGRTPRLAAVSERQAGADGGGRGGARHGAGARSHVRGPRARAGAVGPRARRHRSPDGRGPGRDEGPRHEDWPERQLSRLRSSRGGARGAAVPLRAQPAHGPVGRRRHLHARAGGQPAPPVSRVVAAAVRGRQHRAGAPRSPHVG
jgi:hypothetical protein